jgi:hypothetical protein
MKRKDSPYQKIVTPKRANPTFDNKWHGFSSEQSWHGIVVSIHLIDIHISFLLDSVWHVRVTPLCRL